MTKREQAYKPLLFTTTMRNPERLKDFLNTLKNYNGKILTNPLILNVVKDLIKNGFYETMYMRKAKTVKEKIKNGEQITEKELEEIIEKSPQEHKEAGFDRGWASRFETWYGLAKQLGFVYYEMGKKIEFSKTGLILIDNEHPEFEQQVFLNAFVKYQRNNPFKRVLNENVPLILLLETIKRLNQNKKFNGNGIARNEIPIILCWRDSDSEALYKQIIELRERYRYNPSEEVILEICDKLTGGRHNSNRPRTILKEYPDEFIRKMRLTGLITIRGMGRFIDLNTKELSSIDYILKNYSEYKKYDTEKAYFNYMASIDQNLVSLKVKPVDVKAEQKFLIRWSKHYKWESIKEELTKLSGEQPSKDVILRLIPQPLRLEFLTSLAIAVKYPNVLVKPNYISDDEGLPTSHAVGGKPDIECEELKKYILVEVTMLNGTQQYMREIPSIARHLKERIDLKQDAISLFLAPFIFIDSSRWAQFIQHKEGLRIYTFSIKDFLENLETKEKFYIEN
ncbi:MAG: AlwI family type II restriction endonuclease [Nitrosotalea sp.]